MYTTKYTLPMQNTCAAWLDKGQVAGSHALLASIPGPENSTIGLGKSCSPATCMGNISNPAYQRPSFFPAK